MRPWTKEEPNTASHVKGRGAGGKKRDLVPMCAKCHMEYEVDKTRHNRKYRLAALAQALWNFFVDEYGEQAA